ncbi:hypothetical protein CC2G_008079 [Coprinopsis cinerea AmutBmut pab1-1]|nr:hypothetical protein CC2G_008079 [Coprinopsis cinerea AmutBmut pab1-1]
MIAWKDFLLLATPREEHEEEKLSQSESEFEFEFDIERFTQAVDIHLSEQCRLNFGLTEEEEQTIHQAIQHAPASTMGLILHFRANPRDFEAALRGLFHMNCNIFPARSIAGSSTTTHPFGPLQACCRTVDRSLFATHVYVQHGVGAFYELARERRQQGVPGHFDMQTQVVCPKMECGQLVMVGFMPEHILRFHSEPFRRCTSVYPTNTFASSS